MLIRISQTLLIPIAALAALTLGCGHERLTFAPEEIGHTWFPAPNGRQGVQIMDSQRRGVQEVWYRHLTREGVDRLIDELHGPGSLIWSPDSRWLAINHRDYGHLHDFVVLRLQRHVPIEQPGLMEPVQTLWNRMHPEPMERLSFQAIGWDPKETRLCILAFGAPEGNPSAAVREVYWLHPDDGVVRIADPVPEILPLESPFAQR
jgi:hypothetical protein